TETLANKLSAQIIYEAEVQSVAAGDSAYHITYRKAGKTETVEATKLISTLPAYALSGIVSALHPDTAKALDHIPYVPLCTIHLAYKKEQVGEQAQGFGVLSPEHENAIILGALFNSRIFSHVAPEGRELFTLMIGGARKPELT